jgi:flagellar biosynthetic protein FlhB
MTEAGDKEGKTEEPTHKKITDELDRGNIPLSREAALFASAVALLVINSFLAKDLLSSLTLVLRTIASDPGGWSIENSADAAAFLSKFAWEVAILLAPAVGILMAAGLAASVLQHPPRIVLNRIWPDPKRISFRNGLRRIVGAPGRTEFLKSVLKFSFIALVLSAALTRHTEALTSAMSLVPEALPDYLLMLSMRLLIAVCTITALLFAADLIWVRLHWRRGMRMTRQEVKDELKELEGDPLRKARLRSLALDRRRKNMIASVPKATLVIANPMHYAIALRYLREEGGAPVVLSKGKDLIALKIREIAEKHSIPVIEDKALARSMYDSVEIDQPIPPQFYKAVAEIIHILYVKSTKATAK